MKRQSKKIIAWLTAMGMLFSMGSMAAFADQPLISAEEAQEIAEAQPVMYKVTFAQPENGKVEVLQADRALLSGAEAADNTAIRIRVTADNGYIAEGLTINGQPAALANGAAEYMVTADTVIAASVVKNAPPAASSKLIKTNSVTATTLNLLWTAAKDDHTAAADLQYDVYLSNSNTISSVENCEKNGTKIAGLKNKDMYSVKNLAPDTTYYFNVVVRDEQGQASCYTTKSVKTAASAESTVTGVAVYAQRDSVQPGQEISLYAQVYGENEPSQAVTSTVSGNKSKDTKATVVTSESLDGQTRIILTVGADETAEALTVKVTSAQNTKKYQSITIRLQQPTADAVTGVAVTPAAKTMKKGETFAFGALVTGTGSYDRTVVWSVTGAADAATAIAGGVLTVGAEETAETLTVTATSAANGEAVGTATVTLAEDAAQAVVTGVEITPAKTIALPGETAVFAAKVTGENDPGQAVTWEVSGNNDAATAIAGGVLTIAPGETAATLTVTAKAAADPEKTAAAVVTVSNAEGYQLKVDGGNGTNWTRKVPAGAVIPIVAAPQAGYGFNSDSENKWIAVQEGGLSCIADPTKAETTLTMPNHDLEIKADFVRVYPREITILAYDEKGKTKLSSAAIRTRGGAILLKATVSPDTAVQGVTWESGNTSVATVDANGLVTARKNGEVYITAKANDKDPAGNRVTERIKVTVSNQTDSQTKRPNTNTSNGGSGGIKFTFGSDTGAHTAYLKGYNDGTFRPDNRITRAEAAAIAARLSAYYDSTASYTCRFDDTNPAAWYASAVGFAAEKGIVMGYGDGTFHPDDYVTRAEFSAMMAKATDMGMYGGGNFSDVGNHWAKGYINALISAGAINGYGDGTFRPDQAVTRAEAAKIANGAAGRVPNQGVLSNMHCPFYDVSVGFWGYYDIMEAAVSYGM